MSCKQVENCLICQRFLTAAASQNTERHLILDRLERGLKFTSR